MNAEGEMNYEKGAAAAWREPAHAALAATGTRDRTGGAERLWAWLRSQSRAARCACGAFEWVALCYLGTSSALLGLFAENVPHPWRIIGVQALVAAAVLLLCRVQASYPADRTGADSFAPKFWHFWRHWYPHLFFLFCFEELGHLVHLISPQWQDARLMAFDQWLTGVNPVLWLEQFGTPARNDFMQFAYLTYFVYLLVLGGVLYYRREWHAYWSVVTYSAVAYAIGYVVAISFPIESPWFSMASAWRDGLPGGPFTATIAFIEHFGRVRGAAFPSEHVAGSVAALWGAWRHRRWLFRVMLPLVACMWVSTVWGRYHYVADVLGGMITGTLGYWIGRRIMQRTGAVPADS
jgi:hypothetical protein